MLLRHAQTTPPWILKWGGLESSGQRLISSNGKTKRIVFIFLFIFYEEKKLNKDFQICWKKFRIRETPTLLTNADSSRNTFFFFFGGAANERPCIDLRANERPKLNSNRRGQHSDRQTDRHRNSMTVNIFFFFSFPKKFHKFWIFWHFWQFPIFWGFFADFWVILGFFRIFRFFRFLSDFFRF